MRRTWVLDSLKDKITPADRFVCRESEGLKLSPFPSAMIGQPLPDGWIAFRPMKNERRKNNRKNFFQQWNLWRRGKKSKFKPVDMPDISRMPEQAI
jgi:hypothetical protein